MIEESPWWAGTGGDGELFLFCFLISFYIVIHPIHICLKEFLLFSYMFVIRLSTNGVL